MGTWGWGNRLLYSYDTSLDETLQETFQQAIASGVTLFDTADSYGTGSLNARAESLLGKCLSTTSVPVKIATKFASYPWRNRASIVAAAEASCERLGRVVDLAQMHWSPRSYAPWQEAGLIEGFADAYHRGFVKEVGVSNFGPKRLVIAHDMLRERGVRLRSVQVQMSLICREPMTSGLIDKARELDVDVIGYSPLALGFLGGAQPGGVRGFLFRALKNPGLRAELSRIARLRGCTEAQIAMAWAFDQNVIVLVGCRTPRHVRENVEAMKIRLTDEEKQGLEKAASKGRQMVRNAFQTG